MVSGPTAFRAPGEPDDNGGKSMEERPACLMATKQRRGGRRGPTVLSEEIAQQTPFPKGSSTSK